MAAVLAICGPLAATAAPPSSWGAAAASEAAAQPQTQPQPAAKAGDSQSRKQPVQPADASTESPASPARPRAADPNVLPLKEEAFAVVRRLMEDFPGDIDAMHLMGSLYFQGGQAAEAAAWWQKCIDKDPQHLRAYIGLASVANIGEDYERALELLRKAQQINPTLPGIHGSAAEVLLAMGRLPEAAAALEEETRLSPRSAHFHDLLGQVYFRQKEYEKAARCYRRAIEIAPRSSHPYYGLASVCARLGQADQARQYMEKSQALRDREEQADPKAPRGHDDRLDAVLVLAWIHCDAGTLYANHRRPKEAEEHWRRAIAVDPNDRQCRQALVSLCRRAGRLAEALEFCDQLRRIEPENASYHHVTGILLIELQRPAAAEVAFRRAVELAPADPAMHRSLAQLLLRNQEPAEARAAARKLVELEPTAPNYAILAEACRRCGDMDGAREAMRRAIDARPGGAGSGSGTQGPAPGK
jgi:tetratricopeptide (TPR) repeat protein